MTKSTAAPKWLCPQTLRWIAKRSLDEANAAIAMEKEARTTARAIDGVVKLADTRAAERFLGVSHAFIRLRKSLLNLAARREKAQQDA